MINENFMEKVNTSFRKGSNKTLAEINQSAQRMNMILKELSMVGKEIENKQIQAQSKANILRIVNTLSSLIIIIGAAVIAALEAVSNCISIPILIFSAIIFFTEGTHKLFQWGPQGVLYMHGSIQLKRLHRQNKDYQYFYDKYTPEQLLTLVSMLRAQCDEVDMGLYKLSVSGHVQSNFEIEHNSFPSSLPGSPLQEKRSGTNESNSSHVHIHIDTPTKNANLKESNTKSSTPVLIIPTEDSPLLTPNHPIKQISNIKISSAPTTPQRTPKSPKVEIKSDNIPTIKIDSDDSHETVIDIPDN